MDDVRIERATVDDAAEILALQHLAYQSEAAIYHDFTIAPLTQTLTEIKQDVERQLVLKATWQERIVGSVRGYLRDDAGSATCCIGRLIVHPDAQNRGLGTRLMHAVEWAFPDAARFELFTGHKSERNLYLYGKLGYAPFRTDVISDRLRIVYLEKVRPPVA